MSDIVTRLRENCKGRPATVPWPHRVLHDAADHIERLEAFVRESAGAPLYSEEARSLMRELGIEESKG